MSRRKDRLTVTVDRGLVEIGNEAVASGRAESLSAWVNRALTEWAASEHRSSALREAIAGYEAKYGVISAQELAGQARADRESAIVVRGRPATMGQKRRSRAA